jgi:purine-binding chemotaxis protein CheW
MTTERQYCTFTVGGGYYGVDVTRVQEIVRRQELTCVPLAPPEVSGLINLRGQIVTAIDLRRRLGMNGRKPDESVINVVVTTDDGAISLQADDIGDVLAVPDADFDPPPETLRGPARALIRGAYKLDGRLLLVLDPDQAINLEHDNERSTDG